MKILIVTFALACFAQSAIADCGSAFQDSQEITKSANAFMWSNFIGRDGSLKVETRKMLAHAESRLSEINPPQNFCPQGCMLKKNPSVVFTSIPQKFLSDYEDSPNCQQHLDRTTKTPLKFATQNFPDIDSYTDWFADFSQGKGEEGEVLYERCDGTCSPQFTSVISKTSKGYSIENTVICGHARDKDDGQYTVTLSYRWRCV